jgi:hypothetical protein
MPPKKSVVNGDVGDTGGVRLSSPTFLDHELIITLALQMGRSQRREGNASFRAIRPTNHNMITDEFL